MSPTIQVHAAPDRWFRHFQWQTCHAITGAPLVGYALTRHRAMRAAEHAQTSVVRSVRWWT